MLLGPVWVAGSAPSRVGGPTVLWEPMILRKRMINDHHRDDVGDDGDDDDDEGEDDDDENDNDENDRLR